MGKTIPKPPTISHRDLAPAIQLFTLPTAHREAAILLLRS